MKKSSKKDKIIVAALILLMIVAACYIYAPNIERLRFSIRTRGLDAWEKTCSNSDSGLLQYSGPYWGSDKEGVHVPSADAEVFAIDDVIELKDGVYITGGYGLTDWCMLLHIYSRKDLEFAVPEWIDGNEVFWPFYISSKNMNENDFPFVNNTEGIFVKQSMGYVTDVYLAAPSEIDEEGTITLIYQSYYNLDDRKEIKIPVSSRKLNEN